MKKLMLALLALATLGTLSIPAHADDAKIQTSNQYVTQDGEGNISIQRTRQQMQDYRSYTNQPADPSNAGHVQEAEQSTYQRGYYNFSRQQAEQQIRSNVRTIGNQW